jgi:hypothetical protein
MLFHNASRRLTLFKLLMSHILVESVNQTKKKSNQITLSVKKDKKVKAYVSRTHKKFLEYYRGFI